VSFGRKFKAPDGSATDNRADRRLSAPSRRQRAAHLPAARHAAAVVREPTNKHEALAVQVWIDDQMLGYVPKSNNVEVAWALDGHAPVRAVFAGRDLDWVPAIQIAWERE